MDAPWTCWAAYVYVLHLEPASRAWEYLRRNPRYARDWTRFRRGASQRIAARWGLAVLIDPRLDAREACPVWATRAPAPVRLVRDEYRSAEGRGAPADHFSIWRLAGRKSLFGDGTDLRLTLRSSPQSVQLHVVDRLCAGDWFAYQIPAGAAQVAASRTVAAFHALHSAPSDGRQRLTERPGRTDLFHAHALQVLDGLAAGASQRELAAAIFGDAAVARGWRPDSALRAQVRYLIRRARALMAGEYRSLIVTDRRFPFPRKGYELKALPIKCDIV